MFISLQQIEEVVVDLIVSSEDDQEEENDESSQAEQMNARDTKRLDHLMYRAKSFV